MIPFRPLVVLLLACSLVGCQPTSDRASVLAGVRLVPFTMQFSRTKVPDLSIKVPFGFTVEAVSEAKHDMFYIINPSDSSTPQRVMAVVQVRKTPIPIIPDSSATRTSKGVMLGEGIDWNEATLEDESPQVLQREVILQGIFPTNDSLRLQAFVVGMDSTLVERLVACVETLSRDTNSAQR